MNTLIKNQQLRYLFLCNFAILFTGFGLFPLLPLHAAEFGASPSLIGVYLGITYVTSSAGSILAGLLGERLPRKIVFIAAGLIGMPALFMLGQARSFWQIVILTGLVWFTGGLGISVSSVLASLHTTSSTRGKAFGALALASPLAALLGGIVVGRTVDWGGYSLMFTALTIVWMLWPALSLTRIQDAPACASPISLTGRPAQASSHPLGTIFLLLLATVLLGQMTVSVGRMGISLVMDNQQFSEGEISTANALGGLIAIPATLLIGSLSDTLGRKRLLVLSYLIAMAGTVMLVRAQELWQFWLVSSLILGSRVAIASMAPVYAADLLPRQALGKALPLVGTVGTVSGVAGSAGAGYVLDTFGASSLYSTASILSFIAVVIMAFLPAALRTRAAMPVPERKAALQCAGD
ncbi:MAG TPA: MFS transporter [Anaerolineales bacterium]